MPDTAHSKMFRHTTKQIGRSQEALKKAATRSLNSALTETNEDVHQQTYALPLCDSSVAILNSIVLPLTGNESYVDRGHRMLHTMFVWDHPDNRRIRLMFIQPELCTAMANTSVANLRVLSNARERLSKWPNNPEQGGITASTSKCQVKGRLATYIVDEAGLTGQVSWDHFNAAKARFLFLVTTPTSCSLRALSRASLNMLRSFVSGDVAITFIESMTAFKVTAAPGCGENGEDANKNTCIFVFCDGTFKVLGKLSSVSASCMGFREAIVSVSKSVMWGKFVATLQDA